MKIVDLAALPDAACEEAAQLLVDGFREHWPDAWPDIASARKEVAEALEPGKLCRAAVDESGRVLGWVGGISGYDGNVWELHPLVVAPAEQGKGIGRALTFDLEDRVRERGGLTLWLGTDDEDDMTSLSGVDLYDNLPARIASAENRKGHPFTFYRKCGFVIAGVVPDANGRGKPDILMAKRI